MAQRFWVVSSGNWSGLNWAGTSGGIPGALPPGSTDEAVFDVNSPGPVTVDVVVNIGKLTITNGYTQLFDFQNSITVNGDVTLGSSFSYGSTGALICTTTSNITNNNTLSLPGDLEFQGTNQTFSVSGTWGINGSLINNASGSATLNGGSIDTQKNIFSNSVFQGTTAFSMVNTGTLSTSSGGQIQNTVTINTASSVTLGSPLNFVKIIRTLGTIVLPNGPNRTYSSTFTG